MNTTIDTSSDIEESIYSVLNRINDEDSLTDLDEAINDRHPQQLKRDIESVLDKCVVNGTPLKDVDTEVFVDDGRLIEITYTVDGRSLYSTKIENMFAVPETKSDLIEWVENLNWELEKY